MTQPPVAVTGAGFNGGVSASWTLVWTDADDPDLTGPLAALEPGFTAAAGASRSVRRIAVDTFDRRLHRAGLTLEQATRDGVTWLELTTADGGRTRTPAPDLRWPAFAGDLPAGELQARVARLCNIRALMGGVALRSVERELRVLDGEGKTVARLVVDQPRRTPQDERPVAVTVTAVRGYQDEAAQISELLAATPGMTARSMSAATVASSPAGSPTLTRDLPARQAVATVLHGFRGTLEANVPGLLADIDTEFLHDFRVSVRRARSTLKLTGDTLDHQRSAHLSGELKWLGDLTSPTRDLDVYLLGYPAMASSVAPATSGNLAPFQQHLAQRREVEWRKLARGVRSKRFRLLLEQWRDIDAAADDTDAVSAAASGLDAGQLAVRSVGQARARVVKLGSKITAASPAEDLHTLRKRCKELRYLLEIFAPLHDKVAHRQVLQVLKTLQECLGDFQDSEIQADALHVFAREMDTAGTASTGTLLAMGELAAALHAEQRRARSAFEGTFAEFMQPKNQYSFGALRPATSRSGAARDKGSVGAGRAARDKSTARDRRAASRRRRSA